MILCLYIHTYICIYVNYMYNIYIYIHTPVVPLKYHTYIYTYIHTYIHTYIYIYLFIYIYICVCVLPISSMCLSLIFMRASPGSRLRTFGAVGDSQSTRRHILCQPFEAHSEPRASRGHSFW